MAQNTEKPAPTPEEMARKKAAKVIGYHGWLADWRRANPEADVESRKAAWNEVKNLKLRDARRTLKRLEKTGFVVTPMPGSIAAE
ncbi:hypothetical protein [Maritimibacter sp. DP1N21-5]|uniref:hypothetical protein n=1 Tax=Maritimibacter sp. DP1N21-5 TaxID=2836867 RepID=UPI001C4830C3|nr:hypothetical protein [Maritimibacter sp. DP1N21-5]MBV7410221.1 hypothetical protein [Maritimibacter sp. DP1N21-5]